MPERATGKAGVEPLAAARRTLGRWLAGKPGPPPLAGEAVVAAGLEALVAVERAAGATLVAGAALAGRRGLAGALAGGLPTALGLALGGERAALFLSAAEAVAALPRLAETPARRAPLVVHLLEASIEAAWAGVAAGAAVWTPASLGEACDLALAARRHAEAALAPAVVAHFGPLARAIQTAARPERDALAAWLGSAADELHAAGPAEAALFGAHRRRLPRWHDAGAARRLAAAAGALAPAALGAELGLFAPLAAAGAESAAAELARVTGRALPPVSGRRLHRAKLALVAVGADAETATAVAEALRAEKLDVGVVALHRLAPFPAAELAERIAGCKRVAVLERAGGGAAARALFDRVARALAESDQRPALARLVLAGGGAPLAADALADALRTLASETRAELVLGLPPAGGEDPLPKRAALADALRRDAPALARLAPARPVPAPETRPPGAVTLALPAGAAELPSATEVAELLYALAGGELRGRAAGESEEDWSLLTWAPAPFADPGAAPRVDLLALAGGALPRELPALAAGAALLSDGAPPALPPALVRRAGAGELGWLRSGTAAEPTIELARERWLGALIAAVAARAGVEVAPRKLRTARAKQLAELAEEEREARLAALVAGAEGSAPGSGPLAAAEPLPARPLGAPGLPLAPAPAGAGGLDDPLRFWNAAALPVREGLGATLHPDPLFAVGAAPAHSAPLGRAPERLPAFEPAACTGCGDCWSACPHGAIDLRSLPPGAILERAFEAAGERGADVESLRRFASKLAGLWAAEAAAAPGAAGTSLRAAAERLLAGAKLEPARLEGALAAAEALAEPFAAAPLAAPPPQRAAGELLALAIDPDRCTGCGLCVAVCAPLALADAPATVDRVAAARGAAAAVAALPPTSEATLVRLAGDERVGALAAALADVEAAALLGGVDGAEPGSGARLATRQLLAALGRRLVPARGAALERVRDLAARLAREVHGHLEGALPDRDLEALARGLEGAAEAGTDLAALSARVGDAVEGGRVDVPALRRRVELARALADLEARLAGAAGSAPRAPMTLVVGPGPALAWAAEPLANPFGLPATVVAEAPLALARGLAHAEAERAIGEALVLRRARLELERPGEARAGLPGRPAWSELDEVERALATPVVALLDERAGAGELDVALEALAGELPWFVVTLAAPPSPGRAPSAWAALAFAAQEGAVAHATPAHGEALAAAAEAVATHRRGALVRLLAVSPALDGVRPDQILEIARGAVEARGFPLGRRVAATPAPTAPRVDAEAYAAERERAHAEALAAAEARHAAELAGLEAELRRKLAEAARRRLNELVARRAEVLEEA